MEKADAHLEESLRELNDRVHELEASEDLEQLLEAYVNRGRVLAMMEYRTSALDDFETASELADDLISSGTEVDPGTYVRIHSAMASLIFDQDGDPVEEYYYVASKLDGLDAGSRHYDQRSIVRLCITASEDLIDCGHPEDCRVFVEKGLSMTESRDPWFQNRRMELHGLSAEAYDALNDVHSSIRSCTDAIEVGTDLMERGVLEDTDSLVMILVMRADSESSIGDNDMAIVDLTVAVNVMEGLLENHGLPDQEPLISLHHDLAGVLMKAGRVEEAEKHLIRAMEIGVGRGAAGMDDMLR